MKSDADKLWGRIQTLRYFLNYANNKKIYEYVCSKSKVKMLDSREKFNKEAKKFIEDVEKHKFDVWSRDFHNIGLHESLSFSAVPLNVNIEYLIRDLKKLEL